MLTRHTHLCFFIVPLLIIFVGTLSIMACQKKEPTGYTLKERILISQMVQDSVLVYYPAIDSLCDLEFQGKVQTLADSLYPLKLELLLDQRRREQTKKTAQ